MDWGMVWIALLIWCVAGLFAAIAFGRATPKDDKHG